MPDVSATSLAFLTEAEGPKVIRLHLVKDEVFTR